MYRILVGFTWGDEIWGVPYRTLHAAVAAASVELAYLGSWPGSTPWRIIDAEGMLAPHLNKELN